MTGFIKQYPSVHAAEVAFQRAVMARQAGVCTPAVLDRTGPQSLCFERIEGTHPPDPARLLQVLVPLHRMPHRGLARFDPFLRIRPRLPGAPLQVRALADRLMAQDAALNWPTSAVIHGDFHPGQVLCDAAGQAWLVDLDDLALAPPEADLGNLAAWRATQSPPGPWPLAQDAVPLADPELTGHFHAIALLRRALKLAERGQPEVLTRLTLRA
jgi:hypothetical protein